MTVILVILMVVITATQFTDMINRTSQVLTSQIKYHELSTDSDPFTFTAMNQENPEENF
jgi:hypothetical protein